jgi:hypothetical protein
MTDTALAGVAAEAPVARRPDTPRRRSAEFVFIVGVSRSGTTLVKNILNVSSRVGIATENHFLGHLIPREGARHVFRRFGDLADDRNVERLVDFVYSGGMATASRLRGMSRQWRWTVRNVPRAEFLRRLLAGDRSERAIFTALLETYAEKKGKTIKGEKTPAHVRYVDTLFEWYPDARVIHMIRDPRGIYVSELRRRIQTPESVPYRILAGVPRLLAGAVLLETTIVWAESIWRLRRNRRQYGDNYLGVRFEDLVGEPDREVRRICEFLGIEFEAAMLDQVVVSWGQRLGERGIDRGAADRWRTNIGPIAERWLRAWFGGTLRSLGYRP